MVSPVQAPTAPPRHNNFDAIRLLAALQVVMFHGYEHLHLQGIPVFDVLVRIIRHLPGVPIFFVISGFLIVWSYDRRPIVASYARNRFLRLYPGLWVALLVSIVVLTSQGYLVSASARDVSFWIWLVAQLTIFQPYTPHLLRGYGLGNPNGSLWTIVVELQFYVFVPLIFWVGRGRRNRLNAICLVVLACSLASNVAIGTLDESRTYVKLLAVTIFPYLFYFLFGCIAYLNWDRVERWLIGKSWIWAAAFVAYSIVASDLYGLYLPSYWPNLYGLIAIVLLTGTVLSIAFSGSRLSSLLQGWDISYGIYIYHAIVLNLLVSRGVTGTSSSLAMLLGGTIACALLSWCLVERPALRRKQTI